MNHDKTNQPFTDEISPRAHHEAQMQPLVISVKEAEAALNIGRTKIYKRIRNNELITYKEDRRRCVPVVALHEYVMRRYAEAKRAAEAA